MGRGVAVARGDARGDASRPLPSGWVTFVFTDIVGSTRLLKALGPDADRCFDRHDELLRSAWHRHGGHEINTEGDLFFVAFDDIGDAIDACVHAQRLLHAEEWPAQAAVTVRMGIHAGYARPRGGDYRALAVHQAARIVSAANGGQILVSATALGTTDVEADPHFTDLGRFRVRDFDEPEQLYRVDPADLTPATVAIRATPADRHNLLAPATECRGRDDARSAVRDLLAPGALVSIVGPGGIGKTRLALDVALVELDRWGDGVWFVDLAEVAESSFTATKVAGDLGIAIGAGADATEALLERLATSEMLIVLDNTEPHLSACAELLTVLAACRQICVLTTGREPLNLPTEWVFRLGPLDADAAVELFLDRARRVNDRAEDVADVRRLCERLDNVPLAVEIAASRAGVMSARDILVELDDRFALLKSHDRSLPERHRTLTALLDWSYRLLDEQEQRVFRALSLFAAPFTRHAVAAAVDDGTIAAAEIPDLLWRLVQKSLVDTDTGDSGTRYRLTSTVRLYATDRLLDADETAGAALRLAEWYMEQLGPEQPADRRWVGAVRVELPNLRSLIPLVVDPDHELAQRLAHAIARHHRTAQVVGPGIDDIRRLVDQLPRATPTRVALLTELADLLLHGADVDGARRVLDEATALAATTGELPWTEGDLRTSLGELAIRTGRPDLAVGIAEERLEQDSSLRSRGRMLNLLGIAEFVRGNHERALEAFTQEAAVFEETRDDSRVVVAHSNIAEIALQLGDRATAATEQSLALDLALESELPAITAFSMMVCARLTRPGGDFERAARLHAFGERLLDGSGHHLYDAERADIDVFRDTATSEIGAQGAAEAREQGTSMPLGDAVRLAHAGFAEIGGPSDTT